LLALCAALAMGVVAGCGSDDDDSTSGDSGTSADVETLESGVLSVGTDTPYPPFEIGEPPDISGYDIEVMNGIARRLASRSSTPPPGSERSSATPRMASSTPRPRPPTSTRNANRSSTSPIRTT